MSATGRSNKHAEPAPALFAVAIGMSAGGLQSLRTILTALPADFRAALLVAHHVASPSMLPILIQMWTGREAVFAARGALIRDGVVYVCPAEHHLAVNPDATLALSAKGRIAYVRPSIDWLFETVAASYGARAIGVILSGANADGARGVQYLARAGGRVLVQDPDTCEHAEMPLAAIRTGVDCERLHPCEMASAVVRCVERVHTIHARAWDDPFAETSMPA